MSENNTILDITVNVRGGNEMNEKYEYVMNEIDKLDDVDCGKYNYRKLVEEIDEVLKDIDAKKNKNVNNQS